LAQHRNQEQRRDGLGKKMSVLAVVADTDQIRPVLTWALTFAEAKSHPLTVLCWSYSPTLEYPLLAEERVSEENDALVDATERFLSEMTEGGATSFGPSQVTIRRTIEPDVTTATLAEIRTAHHDLVVAVASGLSKAIDIDTDAAYGDEPLFRRSPCETILLYRACELPPGPKRVLIVAADSPHDQAAFKMFGQGAKAGDLKVTLAQVEDEAGTQAVELGRRELKRVMRDAGVKKSGHVSRRVFASDNWPALLKTAQKSQLVVVGANQQYFLRQLYVHTTNPAIAAIKRAPPLSRLARVTSNRWRTKLSPADYADLMQGLRRGANLNSDFLIMLGLAAGIASLGLIQNSPAVVIGSMLLAPLMTPMIACGLAIAQSNKKLGRRSMGSIGFGFLLTLVVSFLVGVLTPGNEITPQIIARGSPTILDLLVALCSACAAAYALARPNIVGAVAGVAIATALVPPLCSAGISLSYGELLNAQGAALLFATNLVAIVLGAAVTFRLLGVTVAAADEVQRQWVYRITAAMCISLILLAFPLQRGLNKLIDQGKTKPATYPLTEAVEHALVEHIERTPEVELVASGRPSPLYDQADVVVVISSPDPLPRSFSDELAEICRREMGEPELVVEVHCFRNAWQDEDG
jgi:uncharacterized hydrophobic protein (TIGR00271 family)